MGQITQRQTALALISFIFITLLLILLSTWLPENLLVAHRNEYILYLFMTAVLWLIVWLDWRYARHLTVALITVITAGKVSASATARKIQLARNLATIAYQVATGMVSSSSIVPERRSSAHRRMPTAGASTR